MCLSTGLRKFYSTAVNTDLERSVKREQGPSRAGFGKREYEHNAMIAEGPEFYESFLEEPGLTQSFSPIKTETAVCVLTKGCYSWPVTARATSYQGQGEMLTYHCRSLAQNLPGQTLCFQAGTDWDLIMWREGCERRNR